MKQRNRFAKTNKKKKPNRKLLIISAVLVLVVAIGLTALYYSNNSSSKKTVSTHTTPKPTTDKTNPSTSPTGTTGTKQPGGAPTNSSGPATPPPLSDVKPLKPSGTFVSNHKPGQNGSPLEEASVCNTSPNVDCVITFTKDGVVKSLPVKRTDSSGAAYWDWTPKSVGLTAGNWTVTAVVTAASQTDNTQDPLVLEILP